MLFVKPKFLGYSSDTFGKWITCNSSRRLFILVLPSKPRALFCLRKQKGNSGKVCTSSSSNGFFFTQVNGNLVKFGSFLFSIPEYQKRQKGNYVGTVVVFS